MTDIRQLTVDNEVELYEVVDASRQFLGNLTWTQDATIDTIHNYIVATNASSDRLWGIFIDDHPHGCISLRDKGEYDEIGYWLDYRYREQGHVSRAVALVLEQAERTVRARILPKNIASRKILTKNGFVKSGEDDMWHYYEFVR